MDPNRAPLLAPIEDDADLAVAADNNWLLVFDNLSRLSRSMADSLCRLATGGGFGTRTLYANREFETFDAQRPVILTGIDELATRGDLLDRSLILTLEPISDQERRTEEEFWAAFERDAPRIIAGLYSTLASALEFLPLVQLDSMPRMADFAKLGVAVEHALGLSAGTFMLAYMGNRDRATSVAIAGDEVAQRLLAFMEQRELWEGTATVLKSRSSSDRFTGM